MLQAALIITVPLSETDNRKSKDEKKQSLKKKKYEIMGHLNLTKKAY